MNRPFSFPFNFFKAMFGRFPREVGIRNIVHGEMEFISYVQRVNGVEDAYTSVHAYEDSSRSVIIVDKLFFDLDGENSLVVAQEMADNHREVLFIPVASGRKGLHLYVPLHPLRVSGAVSGAMMIKNELRSRQLGLVFETFGKIPDVIDTSVIGDVRRLTRIPGTLRPPSNDTACKPLPVGKWRTWSDDDLKEYMRSDDPRMFDLPSTELSVVDIHSLPRFNGSHAVAVHPIEESEMMPCPSTSSTLEGMVRPCVLRWAHVYEARHEDRVALVSELHHRQFPRRFILRYLSNIGWDDYDPDVTAYQVDHIVSRGYKPPSCQTMAARGKCLVGGNFEHCPFLRETREVMERARKK